MEEQNLVYWSFISAATFEIYTKIRLIKGHLNDYNLYIFLQYTQHLLATAAAQCPCFGSDLTVIN